MRGLVQYLAGPGKANEHDNPHVVSGDVHLMAWYGNEQLDRAGANDIADYLDKPRVTFGTEVRSQVTALDPVTERKTVMGYRDQHVWHCSLSLAADEGALSEEKWDQVARDFMDQMGFTEEGSGKSPARWVAIHHGASAKGNDHIHIAASAVREDGTRWGGEYLDYKRAQDACREIEKAHGLRTVAGREAGLSVRGEKAAERAAAERAGMTNTAPVELAHRVRAAAVASADEAEWVRRVRASGVVVKPYYAKGTTDVVTGYKAALKPAEYNDKLVFYGGGRLGKDLSLPRIREGFETPTLEQADAASAEWSAAARGQAPAAQSGREHAQLAGSASLEASKRLAAFNDRLARIEPGDDLAWADAARDVSGALSAWARFDTDNRDELNAAARQVARSAQVSRRATSPRPRDKASAMGAAFVLMQARTDGKGTVAGMLLMKQLVATATALRDRQAAARQMAEARATHARAVQRLAMVPMAGYGDERSVVDTSDVERDVALGQRLQAAGRGTPRPGSQAPVVGTPSVDGAPDPLPRTPGQRPGSRAPGAGRKPDGYDR
ncbi:relaxase/mobilization nuclease domain-containing protein [Solicola sp. PLA-1-18]|uniref:relaxase/mobilization nuclease domain-containing protein n=1 Tax=Solicola sp. PLA-1-18 TaxID=3380532 RepID=UPI003B77EFE6